MMTSSDFLDEALMADFLEYQPLRGWSEVVWTACLRRAECECCDRLQVGCLCEATTVEMELHRADREFRRARAVYADWFEVHRQPQIDAERRRMAARDRASWRRWRQRQRVERREQRRLRRQRLMDHDWKVLGETGGTGVGEEAGAEGEERQTTTTNNNEQHV